MPTTNALNNEALNNFTVTTADAGVTRSITISNTDNTSATSNAELFMVTGGSSSGDSQVSYTVTGGQQWAHGIDNSVTTPQDDPWKLSGSGTLGNTDVMVAHPAGEINYPLQAAFFTRMTANRNNVTGDGTLYTIVWGSEYYDQGNDFDNVSTFTAPVAGRYFFNCALLLSGLADTNQLMDPSFSTTNAIYRFLSASPGAIRNSADTLQFSFSSYADMDAGDTCVARVSVSGAGLTVNVVDNGAADPRSTFGGHLVA